MNKNAEPIFVTRPSVILKLPLDKHTHVLHPEQVILKVADDHIDIGALCYALRSDKTRKQRQPREVVTNSLLKQRPKQILRLINWLSNLLTNGGKSLETTEGYAWTLKRFIDWADSNGLHACLAGGEATRDAFRGWANDTHERYQRQQFDERNHNIRLAHVCEMLEEVTGVQGLMQGVRKVRQRANIGGGTEPLALHDFAHAVALNQSIFDGLCDLVLGVQPFPYKLHLPRSLGWAESYLWLFPTSLWRLPPHMRDDGIRAKMGTNASWVYDYENGRLAALDEIVHKYKGRTRHKARRSAIESIGKAKAQLDKANVDANNIWRLVLGMHAQRAFQFLFFCNTGANAQVVRDLETDGSVDAAAKNQKFRALKWRANGKEVTLHAPVTFVPRLRRFMELRRYLLQGRRTPYLFFRRDQRKNEAPERIGPYDLESHYKHLLTEIDPQLPKMGPRSLRASVDDYYLRHCDVDIAAAVMGHTVETERRKYARGSATVHHEEMGLFMEAVSESARRQRVALLKDVTPGAPPLEQGGRCDGFGHPEALAGHTPIQPDCKDSQGCLFCNRRILIAGEEDARKVASAAYVMEQLILGPRHEEALRPLITKCDEDLEKIAAFSGCGAMVGQVRKDVFEHENLTRFWADKYQLFLELGILS